MNSLPLRIGVGIVFFKRDGRVWVGRRRPKWLADHSAPIWQMPQGGIEKFEPARISAQRELREETGVIHAQIIDEYPEWLESHLPDHLIGDALKGRFGGHRLKWFAMRFEGNDDEIDLTASSSDQKSEFESWRWAPLSMVPKLVHPHRRAMYENVAAAFAHLALQDKAA